MGIAFWCVWAAYTTTELPEIGDVYYDVSRGGGRCCRTSGGSGAHCCVPPRWWCPIQFLQRWWRPAMHFQPVMSRAKNLQRWRHLLQIFQRCQWYVLIYTLPVLSRLWRLPANSCLALNRPWRPVMNFLIYPPVQFQLTCLSMNSQPGKLLINFLCSLPWLLGPKMLCLFRVSQCSLGPSPCRDLQACLLRRGGLLLWSGDLLLRSGGLPLRSGGLLLRRGGLLLKSDGLPLHLFQYVGLQLRRGDLLPCPLLPGGLQSRLLCPGGLQTCLLCLGGLQSRLLTLASCSASSAYSTSSTSIPGHSTSTWAWPSIPPPVPPMLHRSPFTPLCHKSGLWISVNSQPEVTRSPHGLLRYTTVARHLRLQFP